MTALSIPCTSHEQALAVMAGAANSNGWWVVDGDVAFTSDGLHVDRTIGPPAEWLKALTCETCGGCGGDLDSGEFLILGGPEVLTKACPDCDGAGKPRIEVTALKKHYDGRWAHGTCWCDHPPTEGETHESGCPANPVHVGWVTVTEVLPVEGAEFDNGAPTCIAVYDDGSVELWEPNKGREGQSTDITADVAHLGNPGDLIGRWLLKCEVVG